MANATFFREFNVDERQVFFGDASVFDQDLIRIGNSLGSVDYIGDFTFGQGFDITGNLTEIRQFFGGEADFTITDVDARFETFIAEVSSDDFKGAAEIVFDNDDRFFASGADDLLDGFRGDDLIVSRGGADTLRGGLGQPRACQCDVAGADALHIGIQRQRG
ncbi:MAG: hypothetical protein AAF360_19785 [Pseudomonadota bacterium]